MNFRLSFAVLSLGVLSNLSFAAPVTLRLPPECTLRIVAEKQGIQLTESIPMPRLFFQNSTPLSQFQDALEPQWGFRPDAFTNAFAASRNEIYLLDEEDYYTRNGRYIDDSLAHEYVHFLQVRYQGFDLGGDEFAEMDAIAVQTWFRETILTQQDPCRKN